MVRVSVAQRRKLSIGDKMAGRHGNKGVISKVVPVEDMPFLPDGRPVDIILNPMGVPGRMNLGQVLEVHLGWAARRLNFQAITPVFDGAKENQIEAELSRAWLAERAENVVANWAWDEMTEAGMDMETLRDNEEAAYLYLSAWLGEMGYDVEKLRTNDRFRIMATTREWLRTQGYDPDLILPDNEVDGVMYSNTDASDQEALRVAMIEWINWIFEEHKEDLAEELQGEPAGLSLADLRTRISGISTALSIPGPNVGKTVLHDGKTGEPFDQPVTVGIMHFLKLAHLIEDKAHARSTGPYSLVTQQPLGGKAQFGGQRFGEMEVWALEAYGAAHTLQEMLTVKSDDVQGRVKTYESIVKDEPIEDPGIPASFRVLVKELQSLGLAVEAVTGSGDVIRFGKEDDKKQKPQFIGSSGLLDLVRNTRR